MNWRKRIAKRYKILERLHRDSDSALEEMDCIDHVLAFTGDFYDAVVSYMKEHNIPEVVDIGCAYGHQGEAFIQSGLGYIGIEAFVGSKLYKANTLQYIRKPYPCKLPKKYRLGCSNLCYGYFIHDYEALARDFNEVILGNINDKEEIEKFFRIESRLVPSHNPKEPDFEIYILKSMKEVANDRTTERTRREESQFDLFLLA